MSDVTYLKDTETGIVYAVERVDADGTNPLDDDSLVRVLAWHRRYSSPSENPYDDPDDFLQDFLSNLTDEMYHHPALLPSDIEQDEDDFWGVTEGALDYLPILHLYLLDHSRLAWSTTSFNDPWDSGQVGWVFCPADEWDEYRAGFATYDEALDAWKRCAKATLAEFQLYSDGEAYLVTDLENDDSCCTLAESETDAVERVHGIAPARLEETDEPELELTTDEPDGALADVIARWPRRADGSPVAADDPFAIGGTVYHVRSVEIDLETDDYTVRAREDGVALERRFGVTLDTAVGA